ncbi:hypothetical protein TNCV_3655741 [Trichonephila clavipes]|nr:hypothetical protein TNCV_3655741 [Trichonephila clavipes]
MFLEITVEIYDIEIVDSTSTSSENRLKSLKGEDHRNKEDGVTQLFSFLQESQQIGGVVVQQRCHAIAALMTVRPTIMVSSFGSTLVKDAGYLNILCSQCILQV